VGQLLAAVGQRLPLVADGGLAPPAELGPLVTTVLIVTRDGHPLADWHVARLQRAHPGAHVVSGDLKAAAAALAAQWLPRPEPTGVRALVRGSGLAAQRPRGAEGDTDQGSLGLSLNLTRRPPDR
jgi:hypothetical protein